jgi:catechol-2,3-dioxygenase
MTTMTTTTTGDGGDAPVRTAPSLTGISHVGLTVRDVTTSEAWYSDVLGLVRLFVEPHGTGDGHTIVMTRPGTALFLGLDHHPEADQQLFSERRTGLDHLALGVETRQDLDGWAAHLDSRGIEHSSIVEVGAPAPHAQMTFRDPDGIAIEVFWMGGA